MKGNDWEGWGRVGRLTDLARGPDALVLGVVDEGRGPLALVVGVGLGGAHPLAAPRGLLALRSSEFSTSLTGSEREGYQAARFDAYGQSTDSPERDVLAMIVHMIVYST